jgi:hypothetical protein
VRWNFHMLALTDEQDGIGVRPLTADDEDELGRQARGADAAGTGGGTREASRDAARGRADRGGGQTDGVGTGAVRSSLGPFSAKSWLGLQPARD